MATIRVQCKWCTKMGEHDAALAGQRGPCPYCRKENLLREFVAIVKPPCCGYCREEYLGGKGWTAIAVSCRIVRVEDDAPGATGCALLLGAPVLTRLWRKEESEVWEVDGWVCRDCRGRLWRLRAWLVLRWLIPIVVVVGGVVAHFVGATVDRMTEFHSALAAFGAMAFLFFPILWILIAIVVNAVATRRLRTSMAIGPVRWVRIDREREIEGGPTA